MPKSASPDTKSMVLAAAGAKDALWSWDVASDSFSTSARFRELLGLTEQPLRGTPEDWFERIHPRQRDRVQRVVERFLSGKGGVLEVEHQMRHGNGRWLWVSVRAREHRTLDGTVTHLAGSLSDITGQKAHEQKLLHDALHDALTGLPNRTFFINQLEHHLARARRTPNHRFAVLFLDLDRFKVINDGHGHLVGDRLLKELADRLGQLTGSDHVVARIGGDEFTVLLVDVRGRQHALEQAHRVAEELRQPMQLDGLELYTSASIGIAMSDPKYARAEDLIRDADTALYSAKRAGGGTVVFDAKMRRDAVAAVKLETDLRRASERNEFEVFYQPVVSLSSGHVIGFEALVRWRHPVRGLVAPDDFLPIAEETGMVVAIDRMVLLQACRQLRKWKDLFKERELTLNVNVSARHFLLPDLVRETRAILGATRVRPDDITIEITEAVLLDDAEAGASVIKQLNRLGTRVCIDDFGIGWSSLSYLTRLPVQSLKIDKQFTQTMLSSDEDHKVVQAIVALAHSLNLSVTAEGIDGVGQLARMRELGCQRAQGYYFAAPLEASAAEELLHSDPVY
ncbi:MAG: EAL domain-containing protein [Proteobacteria bacterium]|nr:EAL domain-containing protein [Pseudomonadota bacterium]